MRTGNDRVVVAVAWTPVATRGRTRRAVGGFLRYVQYRDKHRDDAEPAAAQRRADADLRYVAHRDRAAGHGRLFDATGIVGDEERRALAAFVARAAASTKPQLWRSQNGELCDRRRAVYRFVISPERAQGLDLRQLTQAAVSQLEADAGGPIRWIAAEHRNTAHPHVHLIVAGFRENLDGRIQGLVVNKLRLERLKEAAVAEIERERGLEPAPAVVDVTNRPERSDVGEKVDLPPPVAAPSRPALRPIKAVSDGPKVTRRRDAQAPVHLRGTALLRMAARYRWQAEREAARRLFDYGREVA